jgi:alpha-glucosidase
MKSTIAQIFKLILICLMLHSAAFTKEYTLLSPDKKNTIKVNITKNITWSVFRNMEVLVAPSEMSMTLGSGKVLGIAPSVLRSTTRTVNQKITAIVPVKNKLVNDYFNELQLTMKEGYSIQFRAYNDGVAYRFTTALGELPVDIKDEGIEFNFNENCKVYFPEEYDEKFQSHYEGNLTRFI